MHPILILLIGMATILIAIVAFRVNAFLALIGAAIVVSLLAPGEAATRITRVADGFGRTAGNIAIVIALAAIIGKMMMESGAADRIVNSFLSVLGEKRGAAALTGTGFVLAIPVFYDTVFYLLVPLARSMYARTGRHYLKYIMAIAAGGVATHTLVPPTPGPLAVAGTLGIDLGIMILMGALVAMPAAAAGLAFAGWADRRMTITPAAALLTSQDDVAARELPALIPSLLPIALPVVLISSNTITSSMTAAPGAHSAAWQALVPYTAVLGNANLALLLSAMIATWTYRRQRRPRRGEMAELVESSLMSAGIIILIPAAGGAFGATLQAAQIGPAIQEMFATDTPGSGLLYLFLAFGVASVMKIAQGSSTVAMITTAGMLAAMIDGADLPFHRVYIATAIGSGSLVVSWMNDSGFWIFSKMGGASEVETLKSWTPVLVVVGATAMVMTVILAFVLPMR
jgi:GntP family gluconate:H+ symporter